MRADVTISVIVSTRNRAHYLPEVLRTLAAQSFPTFEVIVIDNGSTDDTPAVLDEWCRRDARFRTAREPKPGLSRGKNAGIRLARASLLLFTDDDVRVEPQWVASYHQFFAQREDALIVAGGPIVPIPHDLGRWPDWLAEPALADVGMLHHRKQRRLGRFEYLWGANMAVPRRLFDEYGLWDETAGLQGDGRVKREDSQFFEDTEFQDRIRNVGGGVWFCPDAAVHHRIARLTVTPRRVASNAFARGRSEVCMQILRTSPDIRSAPKRSALGCLLALAWGLLRWGFWSILFRLAARQGGFESARRAALGAGRALDSLRAGRNSLGLFLGASRVAFLARRILLRLMPDTH